MIKFSLILPVYNVEKYLEKCLQSCLDQDIPENEYEIIVVIDGSPDKSIDVAKQMQSSHGNIKIIEQSNGGLSAARNTGLVNACGEYIWFIDSDDFIESNVLSAMYSYLSKGHLDCLWIGWREVDEKYDTLPIFAPHIHNKNSSIGNGVFFMSNILNNFLFAWSFIYKRDFLIKNGLQFTNGMYYEDSDFAFRALPLVERIMLYDKHCYNYMLRKESISHTINKQKLEDICKNCITTHTAYISCSNSLKRFYKLCFSAFYLMFIKEVVKSQNSFYRNYLLAQSHKYGWL